MKEVFATSISLNVFAYDDQSLWLGEMRAMNWRYVVRCLSCNALNVGDFIFGPIPKIDREITVFRHFRLQSFD